MLKKYGEASDVAELRDAGFQWILGEYDIDSVRNAFVKYLKTNREIPTPSDIVSIIDPWTKPLCGRFYQKLLDDKKQALREGRMFFYTDEEQEYIYRYEKQQISH